MGTYIALTILAAAFATPASAHRAWLHKPGTLTTSPRVHELQYATKQTQRIRVAKCLPRIRWSHPSLGSIPRGNLGRVRDYRYDVLRDSKRAVTRCSNPVAVGRMMALQRYGWTGQQWLDLYALWWKESRWSPTARNPSSGACGIAQRLPCPWPSLSRSQAHVRAQIGNGLSYVKGRYGSPSAALAFHRARNWY